MKKIILFIVLAITTVSPMFADDARTRVAVFNTTTTDEAIDEGMKTAVREIISSTLVNSGNYDIVERSLLEQVMQEQQFSNSGAVDDKDATEIGKLAGANKIVLSMVTMTGRRYMMSVKMIDVKTANVEKQKVKIVEAGRLLENIEPITLSLLGIEDGSGDLNLNPTVNTSGHNTPPTPVSNNSPNKNVKKVSAGTKAKYSGIVDLGGLFSEYGSCIEVSTTHGCQILPYLFVGAGLELRYYFDYEEFSLPIYANVRGCFPLKKITPFAEVRLGYDPIMEGMYFAPAVGITVKKFDFSIGYAMTNNFYYGYSDGYYYDAGSYDSYGMLGQFAIRVGLKF